jgi:hypothetical protein
MGAAFSSRPAAWFETLMGEVLAPPSWSLFVRMLRGVTTPGQMSGGANIDREHR